MSAPDIERRAATAVQANGRRLEGYVAVFGQSAAIGDFHERIAPGAFTATLASGRDVLALSDHDNKAVLGRTKSGTLSLREDAKGLHFSLLLPDTRAGNDLVALAQRGDLGGMSFGFIATDEAWFEDTRELRAVDLHEVSVVQAHPAYNTTEVVLRSRKEAEQARALDEAINNPIIFGGRSWLETCR